MSYTTYIESLFKSQGISVAFQEACQRIRTMGEDADALWESRFFERQIQDDGTKKLCPTTEMRVSQAYDEQNLDGQPIPEFLYCDTDGELYPVTVGTQGTNEPGSGMHDGLTCVFSYLDLVANGKVVGRVTYIDP